MARNTISLMLCGLLAVGALPWVAADPADAVVAPATPAFQGLLDTAWQRIAHPEGARTRAETDGLKRRAEAGDPRAQLRLGWLMLSGGATQLGVPFDPSLGYQWLARASQQGEGLAALFVGLCQARGQGTAVSLEGARREFQVGTSAGEPWAALLLGAMQEAGLGGPKARQAAFENYRSAAGAGNAWAQDALAHCYERGLGTARDSAAAATWERRAAEQDCGPGEIAMGNRYAARHGDPDALLQASRWFRRAAENRVPGANARLAELLRTLPDPLARREALALDREAAFQGDPAAKLRVGMQALHGTRDEREQAIAALQGNGMGDDPRVFRLLGDLSMTLAAEPERIEQAYVAYAQAADLGDAHAAEALHQLERLVPATRLGTTFALLASRWRARLDGGDKAAREPYIRSLDRAAEAGNVDAMMTLADLYSRWPTIVPADSDRYVYWLRRAADLGRAYAMTLLAEYYFWHHQPALGVDWFDRAAAKDDYQMATVGAYYLGILGPTPLGLPHDEKKGLAYLQRAAERGNAWAMVMLGNLMIGNFRQVQHSVGRPQDGISWLKRAVQAGNMEAAGTLADLYFKGTVVTRDDGELLHWLLLAAKQRVNPSLFELATLYDQGRGTARDGAEALKWYIRAASNGDWNANLVLGACFETGRLVTRDPAVAYWFYASATGTSASRPLAARLEAALSPEDRQAGRARFVELFRARGERVPLDLPK